MIYSLSEIDANCKKAARGAGLSWGYAEETGKAARWLAAHQLPGAELLAEYLTLRHENPDDYQGSYPRCPLLTGAILCDGGHDDRETSIVLEHVVYPLLLLPYLVQLSKAAGAGLRIQWPDTHIGCYDGVICIKENETITTVEATNISCHWLEAEDARARMNKSCVLEVGVVGQFIEADYWDALENLAHFTYVPATEQSRRGAGPAD